MCKLHSIYNWHAALMMLPFLMFSVFHLAWTQRDLCVVILQVGDAAMVLSLADLEGVEDRNLLAGSLMVLLEQDIHQAQVTVRLPHCDTCVDLCVR
jgi:hypothetical protein